MKRTAHHWLIAIAVMGLFLMGAHSAQAVPVEFAVFENDSGTDVSGLDLMVDVNQVGNDIVFDFTNNSTISASITRIYFEDGLNECLALGSITGSSGTVDFSNGGAPPEVPGGNNISFDNFDFWTSGPPVSPNGIGVGESLQITYSLEAGQDINCVLDDITTSGRIAIHVQSVGLEGESVSAVTSTVIPIPAAVWGGLSLLGLVGLRRRKTNC